MPDLVIGGSGFVGRNLVRSLMGRGRAVFVLDRVRDATGDFTGTFIQGDAQDPELLASVLADVRPDDVYHLAANSDISAGIADASLDFGDTLMTTMSLRSALVQVPVKRLVFASSSAIFGVVDGPMEERGPALPDPVSWYGKAKLASEYVLDSLSAERPGMSILMIRFPNVVGPLATHGVVYDFVRKLRSDSTKLEVLGDGHQTKPYIHVSDLIDGIDHFLASAAPGVTRINIGPSDLVSVREIAAQVCEVLDVSPQVSYGDSAYGWLGDVPVYEFDTSKMRREGFTINTTSREAVRQAAEALAREWTAECQP